MFRQAGVSRRTLLAGGLALAAAPALPTAAPMSSLDRRTAVGWGYNWGGQLGIGGYESLTAAKPAIGMTKGIRQVSVGTNTMLLLTDEGEVWVAGSDTLGVEDTAPALAPIRIPGLSGIVHVSAGASHCVAVRSDGTALAWGENLVGQVGNGTQSYHQNLPAPMVGVTDAVKASAGAGHTLLLRADGTALACGNGTSGAIGNGLDTIAPTPVPVYGLHGITDISAGEGLSLALCGEQAVAWGRNDRGQVGDGTTEDRYTPVACRLNRDVRAISAGYKHCLAIVGTGHIAVWGDGADARLGEVSLPPEGYLVEPTIMDHSSNFWVEVSAGETFSLARSQSGVVHRWGTMIGDGNLPITYWEGKKVDGIEKAIQIEAGRLSAAAIDDRSGVNYPK